MNDRRGQDEPRIYEMLIRLRGGGNITVSKFCSPEDVALAKVERRYYEDKDGTGYVYRGGS